MLRQSPYDDMTCHHPRLTLSMVSAKFDGAEPDGIIIDTGEGGNESGGDGDARPGVDVVSSTLGETMLRTFEWEVGL